MTVKKQSCLELAFEANFRTRLERAGWRYETQYTLPGERYVYDVLLVRGRHRVLIEIDGNGLGHSSVMARARDAQKANHAILSGYLFFRVTTKHFVTRKKTVQAGEYCERLIMRVVDYCKKLDRLDKGSL